MAAYYEFTVDAVGQPEMIIVQSVCQRVTVRQKDQSDPTLLKFKVRRCPGGSYVQYQGGDVPLPLEKLSWFQPGEIAGCIETNSGSAVFSQIEEP